MKIVVTGALGHIGSKLIRALPNWFTGVEIVMIDNMATLRYASLFDLPARGRYRFIEADVRHADLRPLFKDAYAAVHLAATTDAAGSVDNAAATEANNYNATAKVAAACAETGTRLIRSVVDERLRHTSRDRLGGLSGGGSETTEPLCRE